MPEKSFALLSSCSLVGLVLMPRLSLATVASTLSQPEMKRQRRSHATDGGVVTPVEEEEEGAVVAAEDVEGEPDAAGHSSRSTPASTSVNAKFILAAKVVSLQALCKITPSLDCQSQCCRHDADALTQITEKEIQ